MAKEEIACFENILLFSQCFQKPSAAEASKRVYMWERAILFLVCKTLTELGNICSIPEGVGNLAGRVWNIDGPIRSTKYSLHNSLFTFH